VVSIELETSALKTSLSAVAAEGERVDEHDSAGGQEAPGVPIGWTNGLGRFFDGVWAPDGYCGPFAGLAIFDFRTIDD